MTLRHESKLGLFSFLLNYSAYHPTSPPPITSPRLTFVPSSLQDLGDFNIATSSLHALSNTLSRTDKPSPHSSPRQHRKGFHPSARTEPSAATTNPPQSVGAAQGSSVDVYSSCSSSSSGSAIYSSGGANAKVITGRERPVSSTAVAKALNRLPSSESSGTECVTSPVSQSMLALHHVNDELAPPLPPRKCALVKPDTNATPQRSCRNGSNRSSAGPLASKENVSAIQSSEDGAAFGDFEVPRTIAPPVPKHQTHHLPNLVPDSKRGPVSELDEGVIVGPAETISGLIDTRPLEARKPIIIKNPVPSPTENVSEVKETVIIDRCSNGGNNLYHLKASSSPLSHVRHQSLTMPNAALIVPKSVTTPQLNQADPGMEGVSTHTTGDGEGAVEMSVGPATQPLLYENVSINNKDCNVPYENINLEYIARLVSEGYSKENAITALGISRNNIEMACDILHEFVSKSSV